MADQTVTFEISNRVDTPKLEHAPLFEGVAEEIALSPQGDLYDLNSDEGLEFKDNGIAESYGNSTGEIRSNQDRIDLVNAYMNKVTYSRYDYGVDNISGDFYIEFTFNSISQTGGSWLPVAGVSDYDINSGSLWGNGNGIFAYVSTGTEIKIASLTGGSVTTSSAIGITLGATYCGTLIRSGSTSSLYIYLDDDRQTLHGSVTSFSCDTNDTRYFYTLSNFNLATSRYATIWADDYRFINGSNLLYSASSPSPAQVWNALPVGSIVKPSTAKLIVYKDDVAQSYASTDLLIKHAANNAALSVSITQAAYRLLGDITITDETNAISLVPVFVSDGSYKTGCRAVLYMDVTFPTASGESKLDKFSWSGNRRMY